MIVIDMDMPTDCVDCPIDCFPYGAEDTDYDTTNRPSCCPIKCDIEDVKAEIEEGLTDYIIGEQDTPTAKKMFNVMDKALEIIDKHTKGVKE